MLSAAKVVIDSQMTKGFVAKPDIPYGGVIHVHTPFLPFEFSASAQIRILFTIRNPDQHLQSLSRWLYQSLSDSWHDKNLFLNHELKSFLYPPSLRELSQLYPRDCESFFLALLAESPELVSYQMRWVVASLLGCSPFESYKILWEMSAEDVLDLFRESLGSPVTERVSFLYLPSDGQHRFLDFGEPIPIAKHQLLAGTGRRLKGIPWLDLTRSEPALFKFNLSLAGLIQDRRVRSNLACMRKFIGMLS